MKKILLLLVGISLATTSCEDDIVSYEKGLMRGDWKLEKTVVTNGKNPTETLATETPSGCAAKNTISFGTNNEFTETQYYGTTPNCVAGVAQQGTFLYNSDERKLTISPNGYNPQNLKVLVLTSSEMICQYLDQMPDINADNVPEIYTVHFKR